MTEDGVATVTFGSTSVSTFDPDFPREWFLPTTGNIPTGSETVTRDQLAQTNGAFSPTRIQEVQTAELRPLIHDKA